MAATEIILVIPTNCGTHLYGSIQNRISRYPSFGGEGGGYVSPGYGVFTAVATEVL